MFWAQQYSFPHRWVLCKCFLMRVVVVMYEGLFILAERVVYFNKKDF